MSISAWGLRHKHSLFFFFSLLKGAVGTLTHSVLLHGWNYATQFEIAGDGFYIILKDPYGKVNGHFAYTVCVCGWFTRAVTAFHVCMISYRRIY